MRGEFVIAFLSDAFRETERMLDNIIAEGQMLQSKAYEMKLKSESQKAIGIVTGNLVTEGIKHFIGIPKKYVTPFMKRTSIESAVDDALKSTYEGWLNRIFDFLERVSEYSPSIKAPNSKNLQNRVTTIHGKYVHIDTRMRHIVSFLNKLRNKQLVLNDIIPEIVKTRKGKAKTIAPRKLPSVQSVDVLQPIRRALDEMRESLRRYTGRAEHAFGYISEIAVKTYYELNGYNVKEASNLIDQQYKIDLIATQRNEVLMIQVKKGQISPQEITEVFSKACTLLEKPNYKNIEQKIVIIVASRFPEKYLSIRDKLMIKSNVELQFLHSYHIMQKTLKKIPVFSL